MPKVSSSTPLMSIEAVVLDTETTGLDAKVARIVQVGAVRIEQGELLDNQIFDQFVNPGQPVPSQSTAIHGILDEDVQDAMPFAVIALELEVFTGRAIIIGHNIGYDLSVLKREYQRSGLSWTRPRTLDTLLLSRIANPTLADYSLEAISSWLGIELEGRHSAIGDALTTARIFLGLVPLLRAKGVRTLAEAERASRSFGDALVSHAQAGWLEPVIDPAIDVSHATQLLAAIDSFLYRHRVQDIMATPPLLAQPDWPPEKLGRLLAQKGVSSAFIKSENETQEFGIVTERDLMRALSATSKRPASLAELMSFPLQTVPADAYLYQAMSRMRQLNVRHLGVTDRNGRIVGALTNGDLLKLRAGDAILLGGELAAASNAAALGAAWARMSVIARKLFDEQVPASDIISILSEELCEVTKRAAEIAEAKLLEEDHGAPPVAYSLLVLGSGGRGESLIAPDQDNAIIYQSGAPGGPEDQWFERLGKYISDILDAIGIPYCNGGVMASNKTWRHSLPAWKSTIDAWVTRSSRDDLLHVDIFYDFRCVHGDEDLAREVWQYAYHQAYNSPPFLMNLARIVTQNQAPIGFFGNIRADSGHVDIKKQALLSIVGGARMLALRHDVEQRSTKARMDGVRQLDVGNAEDLANIMEAHEILVTEALEQQLIDVEEGVPPSYRVELKRLTRRRRSQLRWALQQVDTIDATIGDPAGAY